MSKKLIISGLLVFTLAGCSSIGAGWNNTVDFILGADDDTEARKEAAAQKVKNLAETEDPGKTLLAEAVNDATSALGTATANAIDNSIPNSRTDISITSIDNRKTRYNIRNVTGFATSSDGLARNFMQTSLNNANSRTLLNIGFGRRFLSSDEKWMTGINAFFDYDADYGHQRASVGGELKSSSIGITANSYQGLTKWKSGKDANQEHVLDGYDIELGAKLPYMPGTTLFLKTWKWSGKEGVADTKGKTYSLNFSYLIDGVTVEVGRRDFDDVTKDENFARLSYSIPIGNASRPDTKPLLSDEMFQSNSMRDQMLEPVRRNNAIAVQTKFTSGVGGV